DAIPRGRCAPARAGLGTDRGGSQRSSAVATLRLRAGRLPLRASAGSCARTPAVSDGAATDRRARREDDAALRHLGRAKRRSTEELERAGGAAPPRGGARLRA